MNIYKICKKDIINFVNANYNTIVAVLLLYVTGIRHTLYTVHTRFIFQYGICACSSHHKVDRFHASDSSFICLKCLHFPATTLCVVYIHTVNFSRKKPASSPPAPARISTEIPG